MREEVYNVRDTLIFAVIVDINDNDRGDRIVD